MSKFNFVLHVQHNVRDIQVAILQLAAGIFFAFESYRIQNITNELVYPARIIDALVKGI
jgi:hypothetical protein